MLYLCVENKSGAVLALAIVICALIASSTNEWMEVVDVATPTGIYTASYGIWGLKATKRVSELSASGFHLWPNTRWNEFCTANFETRDCEDSSTRRTVLRFCDGFEAVCGSDMDGMQAIAVLVLIASSALCALLLFGSRRHRIVVLYSAAALCLVLIVLTLLGTALWMHITESFGNVPVAKMHFWSSSSASSGTHSLRQEAMALCNRYTQNCYSLGYGFPFFFASAICSVLAFPIFIYAAYSQQKLALLDHTELRDPFLVSK